LIQERVSEACVVLLRFPLNFLCLKEEAAVHRLLWQLFHLGKDIEANAQTIRTKSKELKGLKKQQV
jgi:hypothetical protein